MRSTQDAGRRTSKWASPTDMYRPRFRSEPQTFTGTIGRTARGRVVRLRTTLSHSSGCYSPGMGGREVLREVMTESKVSQSELSRMSGVRQPSISQFLSGRIEMSDEMLDRLLSCLGYRLEVVRRPVRVELDRSHLRSWRLHRQLATHLDTGVLDDWVPTIRRNVERLRHRVQGEPHVSNLGRWEVLMEQRDVPGLRRVMTGLDTDSVQMREVSPLGGLLPQSERAKVLAVVGR